MDTTLVWQLSLVDYPFKPDYKLLQYGYLRLLNQQNLLDQHLMCIALLFVFKQVFLLSQLFESNGGTLKLVTVFILQGISQSQTMISKTTNEKQVVLSIGSAERRKKNHWPIRTVYSIALMDFHHLLTISNLNLRRFLCLYLLFYKQTFYLFTFCNLFLTRKMYLLDLPVVLKSL